MIRFEDFGERLRTVRVERGLTQQGMAELCQVSHMTIRRLESNETKPQGELLATVIDRLGVDLNWLLTGENSTQAILQAECVPLYASAEDLLAGDDEKIEWIKLPGDTPNSKAMRVASDDMIPTLQVGDVVVFVDEALQPNDVVIFRDARGKSRVRFFSTEGGGSLMAEKQGYPPIQVDASITILGKVVKAIRTIAI